MITELELATAPLVFSGASDPTFCGEPGRRIGARFVTCPRSRGRQWPTPGPLREIAAEVSLCREGWTGFPHGGAGHDDGQSLLRSARLSNHASTRTAVRISKETRANVASHRTKRAFRAAVECHRRRGVVSCLPRTSSRASPRIPAAPARHGVRSSGPVQEADRAGRPGERGPARRADRPGQEERAQLNQANHRPRRGQGRDGAGRRRRGGLPRQGRRPDQRVVPGRPVQQALGAAHRLLRGRLPRARRRRSACSPRTTRRRCRSSPARSTWPRTRENKAAAAQKSARGRHGRGEDADRPRSPRPAPTWTRRSQKVQDAYNSLSRRGPGRAGSGRRTTASTWARPVRVARPPRWPCRSAARCTSWGADGPDTFDCSGLTMCAYRRPASRCRTPAARSTAMGKSVSNGELQAGDLLFYGSSAGSIHHVAMYIGDGMLVHASTSGIPVKTADAPYGARQATTSAPSASRADASTIETTRGRRVARRPRVLSAHLASVL